MHYMQRRVNADPLAGQSFSERWVQSLQFSETWCRTVLNISKPTQLENKKRHDLNLHILELLRLRSFTVPCSTDQSHSWEAGRSSAGQKAPRISLKQKVHYRIHNSQPPVPILSQIDPQSLPPHPTPRRSILILSSHVRLCLPSGLLPSGFPAKTLYAPLLSQYVLHALPTSVFMIWSPKWCLVRSTEHKTPCYVVFSTRLLPHPS
jgi:hypothetical protein